MAKQVIIPDLDTKSSNYLAQAWIVFSFADRHVAKHVVAGKSSFFGLVDSTV